MGKVYKSLNDSLREFITRQQIFFVATAPLSGEGHVNVSPKGLDTFHVLDAKTVAYLDLTGSGIETVAHLRENGRMTMMFCAFEGAPRIVRLYGRGRVVELGDHEWESLATQFIDYPSARSVIVIDLTRVADSCGYGVPIYEFIGQRNTLPDYAQRKGGREGARLYQRQKNRTSIDGLPGLRLEEEGRANQTPRGPE